MTQALVSSAPTAIAISVTAMMAFARPYNLRRPLVLPVWVPWVFLIVLGVASCLFALTHPGVVIDPDLSMPF